MFVDCPVKTKVSWEWQPFGVGLSGSIKDQHTQGRAVDSAKLPSSTAEVNETHTYTHTQQPESTSFCCRKEDGETFNCPLSERG